MKRNIAAILTLVLFALIALPSESAAQSLVLNQYIEEALEQNLSLKSSELSLEQQEIRIQQAKRLWNPSLNLESSYLFAEGGRRLNFPIGDLFNPAYATLNQLTGSSSFPTDLENVETQLTPNDFLDAQLSLSKPIINSTLKYNRKIQEELLGLNKQEIALTQIDITYQVKMAYFNFLKTEAGLKVLNDTEELLLELKSFNQALVDNDKATEEIVSDVDFRLQDLLSQKATLTQQHHLSKALFNLLLKRDLEAEIEIDPDATKNVDIELEGIAALKSQAKGNRLEFRQLETATKVNALNQKLIKKEALPTVGVSAGIGVQAESFDFDAGGALYTAAVGMSMKIFDGGVRKKKVQELAVASRQLQNNKAQLEQQVEIEVTRVYYELQSILAKARADSAAVKSAKNSFDITKVKYENEKALLIEYLQAQNRLASSQLNQTLSRYDFLIKKAELLKITASK